MEPVNGNLAFSGYSKEEHRQLNEAWDGAEPPYTEYIRLIRQFDSNTRVERTQLPGEDNDDA